jgi:hypothetical protein
MNVIIVAVFGLGYFCGSMTQRQAEAQIGGLLEKAGQAGGPVGSVAQFGSSLTEMQDHISGLQKNLDTFKKVQASLTGK